MLIRYLKRNWIIYSLLGVYLMALILNAAGVPVWLPSCPIFEATGVECLGCGLNRAAIAFLTFRFTDAFTLNPLIYLYIPLFTGWIIYDFRKFSINQHKIITRQNHGK